MSISNLLQQNNYNVVAGAVTVNGGSTNDSILNLGNSSGFYTIKRTENNKELSIFQNGDSVNSNIVLTTGTGSVIQYGAGGMQINGNLISVGDLYVTHKLFDHLNSSGAANHLLSTDGLTVSWIPAFSASVNHDLFFNSKGDILNNNTYITMHGLDANLANASYAFSRDVSINNILVHIDVAPTVGNSWTFWIQKNGVDTALFVTLSDNEMQKSQAGNISYTAGDHYSVRIEMTAAPLPVNSCLVTINYN